MEHVSFVINKRLLYIFSFECCVAKQLWLEIREVMGMEIRTDFESVAWWWVSNKNCVINMVSSAVSCCLWNWRKGLCFQGKKWRRLQLLLDDVARYLRWWKTICPESNWQKLEEWTCCLEKKAMEPSMFTWPVGTPTSAGTGQQRRDPEQASSRRRPLWRLRKRNA